MAQIFFPPGPRYDTLSSRLSLMRSGVTRRHHVLNVFNQRVAGRRHDDLKIRQSLGQQSSILETDSHIVETCVDPSKSLQVDPVYQK